LINLVSGKRVVRKRQTKLKSMVNRPRIRLARKRRKAARKMLRLARRK
jgi:hypothetical protein